MIDKITKSDLLKVRTRLSRTRLRNTDIELDLVTLVDKLNEVIDELNNLRGNSP